MINGTFVEDKEIRFKNQMLELCLCGYSDA